jgi:hypothetical protein
LEKIGFKFRPEDTVFLQNLRFFLSMVGEFSINSLPKTGFTAFFHILSNTMFTVTQILTIM